jgi:hypothetical protein
MLSSALAFRCFSNASSRFDALRTDLALQLLQLHANDLPDASVGLGPSPVVVRCDAMFGASDLIVHPVRKRPSPVLTFEAAADQIYFAYDASALYETVLSYEPPGVSVPIGDRLHVLEAFMFEVGMSKMDLVMRGPAPTNNNNNNNDQEHRVKMLVMPQLISATDVNEAVNVAIRRGHQHVVQHDDVARTPPQVSSEAVAVGRFAVCALGFAAAVVVLSAVFKMAQLLLAVWAGRDHGGGGKGSLRKLLRRSRNNARGRSAADEEEAEEDKASKC